MIDWPTPKHVPAPGGSRLNPRRVDDLMAAIKQELVAGEMIDLANRILEEFTEDETEPTPIGAEQGERIACTHCGGRQRLPYLECTECGKCGDVRILPGERAE